MTTNASRARRRQSPRARPGGTRQSTLVHKRDPRTGRSVWQDRPLPGLAQSTLRRDLATDVLVIGAGISGAMIAELLSDAGLRVVVVDRRGPVLGSTAASTALLQYELDLPLHRLAARIGRTRAERIWRRSRLALEARRRAGFEVTYLARGARLHAPVEVSEVDASASVVHCATTRGPQVRASHVVFATGYEMPGGALVWEASDPCLYLRTTPDGRVICGGEDEPFVDEGRRDALLPGKTATLERRLARLFPALDARAQYRWTGSFGASPTGTPTVGPIPGMPRCYAVLGRGDPDSDLVAFGRKR